MDGAKPWNNEPLQMTSAAVGIKLEWEMNLGQKKKLKNYILRIDKSVKEIEKNGGRGQIRRHNHVFA